MKFNLSKTLFFLISLSAQFVFAQNTLPPEMPIPPEFQQPQAPPNGTPPNTRPAQNAPVQAPSAQTSTPEQGALKNKAILQNQVAPSQNQPLAQPVAHQAAAPAAAQMPSDFELIAIKPYFKNKPKMGHLTATLFSANNDVLGSVSSDFGDCQNCIRGASVKGKIGVRLYGNEVTKLTVSRKQSSSIQITACNANNNRAFVNNFFNCEFMHNNTMMKLTLKLDH